MAVSGVGAVSGVDSGSGEWLFMEVLGVGGGVRCGFQAKGQVLHGDVRRGGRYQVLEAMSGVGGGDKCGGRPRGVVLHSGVSCGGRS